MTAIEMNMRAVMKPSVAGVVERRRSGEDMTVKHESKYLKTMPFKDLRNYGKGIPSTAQAGDKSPVYT